jgi:hypothetical protein
MLWIILLLLIHSIDGRKLILHAGAGHKIGSTQVVISPINNHYSIELYDVDGTLICTNEFYKLSVYNVDDVCISANVQNLNGVYVVTMDHPNDEYGTVEAHLIVNGRKTIENIRGTCPNGSRWRCDQAPTEPPTTTPSPTPTPTTPSPTTPSPTLGPTIPPIIPNATSPIYYNIRYVYNYYYSSDNSNVFVFLILLAFGYYLYNNISYSDQIHYYRPSVYRYRDYKNNINY